MEEKYGETFLKLKKHEMQYELKKQLEEKLIKNFHKIVQDISQELKCESQTFENKIQFVIYSKNQHITLNFGFEELQALIKSSENLKAEIRKLVD